MKSITQFVLSVLFFILLFVFCGCGILKKVKTVTETITITKLDTIIIIQKDTVITIKEVNLYDTAFIEIETSKARSYYNPIKRKIVLELTGKAFNLPVSFNQIVKTKTNVNEIIKNKKIGFHYYVFVAMVLIFLYAYLTRKK